MFVKLERFPSSEKQTLGIIQVFSADAHLLCSLMTLELPRKQNQKRISCIPPGSYTLHPHTSIKFGNCFWVKAADENPILAGGRSEILIHAANYHFQLLGCIAPGLLFYDLNDDGEKDVSSSAAAVSVLRQVVKKKCEFIIIDPYWI